MIDAFEDAFENEDEACELKRFLTHLVAPLQDLKTRMLETLHLLGINISPSQQGIVERVLMSFLWLELGMFFYKSRWGWCSC